MAEPSPLRVSGGKHNHKVTMFNSPDHSIQPMADCIQSATKSLDMYIPEMISWTYGDNNPRVPQLWVKEENPIFQALANVGMMKKALPIRIVTNGPQVPFVPFMANMWEWLILQNAKVNFAKHIKIGGILIMIDGGNKILLTSMNGTKDSFVINRESSVIIEKPSDEVVKYFKDAFEQDFKASLPFLPNKESILGTKPPLIDPVASALIMATKFPITSIPQPPEAFEEASDRPFVSKIVTVDDAAVSSAMVGPKLVEKRLIDTLNASNSNFLQVGIRSLPYKPFNDVIFSTYQRVNIVTVIMSYHLDDEAEAKASNGNLYNMQVDGMFRRLLLGPLLTQSVKTKDYYKRNGQAFINTADQGGTVHFMTGSFCEEDVTKVRHFYIGINSRELSRAVTRLVDGDQTRATYWSEDTPQIVLEKDKGEAKSDKQGSSGADHQVSESKIQGDQEAAKGEDKKDDGEGSSTPDQGEGDGNKSGDHNGSGQDEKDKNKDEDENKADKQ